MTDREGLQRKPSAGKKTGTADDSDVDSLSPTLRRYRAAGGGGRRARHSAPDLSFGGKVDTELLKAYQKNLELMRINEPAVRSYARRGSLGTELEHIKEEEATSDEENNNSNSLSLNDDGERLLPSSIRLPPIHENAGYKLSKRDFSRRLPINSEQHIDVTDAVKYRYIRSRTDSKGRKMSM